MTEISFRFNVEDPLDYVCRYLRKVQRAGRVAVVAGGAEALARLDRALWSFDPTDFVPHLRLAPGQVPQPRQAATPVWLVERTADAPRHELLLNLGAEPAEGFETFERVVEVVSTDEADRAAARNRWRHYQSRGYKLESHSAAEPGESR